MKALFVILFLFVPLAATAQHEMHDETPVDAADDIGTVAFDADCDEAVRAKFDRALALMHHMMYEQARGQFADIAEADPGCAMAHWGVATTLFQPLWGTTPDTAAIERGRAAIVRAREAVDDERERALVEATAAFFEPESERLWDRLSGWTEGMAAAHAAHGEDPDVAALYGLSLLTEAQRADDRQALHDEAEAVLRRVWEAEPTHPGAVHYTIHATDADGRAGNAPEIVASYGEIAPNVPHALHMPSHIYVRLGDWPRVIEWNERSAAAARDHRLDDGSLSFHYIHAADYLVYGHLQRGEDDRAAAVWGEVREQSPHQGNFPGAFHLASIPARLAVERRDWAAARAIEPRTPDYITWEKYPWPEAISRFARGLGAYFSDDLEVARAAEARLAALAESAESAADGRFQTYIEADRRILAGWLAHADGDHERAVESMRRAIELEASVEKHPVTPGALYPPGEALGDLLSELGRHDEALEAYEQSDAVWPGRHNTLQGAIRAAERSGDEQAAARLRQRLEASAPESERRPAGRFGR